MKRCKACGQEKAIDEFYAMPQNSDGLMGKCKACWVEQVKERRRTDPSVREYDRKRAKTPARKAKARRVTIKWREKHPEAYRAQTKVGNAIRDGKLFKGPCAECGETEGVHAHHADYSKALEVAWLCPLHHHRHHAEHGDNHGDPFRDPRDLRRL